MTTTILAHVAALLLIAPLGALAGALAGGLALGISRSPAMSFAIGAFGALVAFTLATMFFAWMEVPFGWLAWLCVFLPLALNDGARAGAAQGAAREHEQMVAAGTLITSIGYGIWLMV